MVWYGGRGSFGGGLSPIFAPYGGVLLCAKTVPNWYARAGYDKMSCPLTC
jgi:hypothetical protein